MLPSENSRSSAPRHALWLAGILLFALASRLTDLGFDDGHAFHPDERAVAFAVERLSFQPLQLDPHFFAYGSLPFYLARAAASLVSRWRPLDFEGLLLLGRTLSALAGFLTVLALFRLARALHGPEVALLAAGLLSACVLHIQHSHFMTGESLLTLLALLSLGFGVRLARYGRSRDALLAGGMAGLALATKASAAPLLAPLGVALLLSAYKSGRWRTALTQGALALGGLLAAFALGEPYAFLDFPEFRRQLLEQAGMVRHAGSLPYTLQYVGATPYLYDLGQMVLWGMAPALGLAVLWAAGRRSLGFLRERRGEDAVLLAWVLPFVAITGSFQVKFMRYLLPAYPVLILWAAAWLWETRGTAWGRVRLRLVVVGTGLAALAFLAVYRGPHTAVAASRWIYANAPAGSTVLTSHWDEGFPLPLPEGQPDRFHVVSFPFYDADTPAKRADLAQALSRADYVAFPTKRIYGAITGVPDRYPDTDRALRQLFAGRLGFRLAHVAASRPRLLCLEALDELADESFSAYDHPKAVVFARSEALGADQLLARFASEASELPGRGEVLTAGSGAGRLGLGWAGVPARSSVLALVFFAGAVQLLGLAGWRLLGRWLPGPGGYALARVLGLLAFAFPCWLLGHLAGSSFDRPLLAAVFAGLLLAAWRAGPAPAPPGERRAVETLFWGCFAVFLAVRAWNPAIFWGEKPMDFSILNVLERATALPPPDPWFSGSTLHYTYFGHFLVAALGKLCAIHPALGFNLGIALVAGLAASAAYAAGCAAGGSRTVGPLAAVLAVLVGNLSGPFELLKRGSLDFDTFWATSRVVPDTINEYPLWSLLFADLHAHLLALPLSLAFLALSLRWARGGFAERPGAGVGLLGLVLGAVLVTSAWSGPTLLLWLPFLLGCCVLGESGRRGVTGSLAALGRDAVAPSLAVAAVALVSTLPFWLGYRPPEGGLAWERDAFAPAAPVALVFGLPLFVSASFLAARIARERIWRAGGLFVAVALGVALALPGAAPLLSARTALLVAAFLATLLATRRGVLPRERAASALFAFACFVVAGCDTVHVIDRMNTVFKFYLDAWLLLAVSAAAALPSIPAGLLPRRLRGAWWAAAAVLAGMAVSTGVLALLGTLRTTRVPTPRASLDGTAWLARSDPAEAAAIDWLNAEVAGTPALVEAWGPSYGEFSRISMNTGLPTLLGWEYHVFQRGHPWPEIEERKQDLAHVFAARGEGELRALLSKYGARFVYAGPLERRLYGDALAERLAGVTGLLRTVYANPGVRIFAVSETGAPLPTRAVPVAAPTPAGPPLGDFAQARALALDAEGRVFVADFDHNRIQVLDPDLEPAAGWGGEGSAPGSFRQPCDLAVRGDEVFVADTWNGRVQVFDRRGRFLRQWGEGLYGPRGIAVGRDGTVWVSDTGNHRLRRFDVQGHEGPALGGRGSGPGEFVEPMGLALEKDGGLVVCDNGNARVQVFDSRQSFVRAFPVPGWRSEVFSEPKVVLARGLVWVTVPLSGEVRAYTPEGSLRRTIAAGAGFGRPLGIAFGERLGALLVSDAEGHVVRVPLNDAKDDPR